MSDQDFATALFKFFVKLRARREGITEQEAERKELAELKESGLG